MPLHALPRGPERRARRQAARLRQQGRWRNGLPVFGTMLIGLESFQGWPSVTGSTADHVLGAIGSAAAALLFVMLAGPAVLWAGLRADRIRQAQAAPRPRWQYLAIAAGWLAAAGGTGAASVLLGLGQAHPGWLARACSGVSYGLAVPGLAMLGRAACRGRARVVFWWYRPLWVTDAEATWFTPPRAPAPAGTAGAPAAGESLS